MLVSNSTILTIFLATFFLELSNGHLDVKFKIHTLRLPSLCAKIRQGNHTPGGGCELPYTLSLLSNRKSDFDITASMMQDGNAKRTSHRNLFTETTLMRISENLQIARGDHILLGLKFFNLPSNVQDYFIIDVTKLVAGQQMFTSVTVSGDDFSFSAKISPLKSNKLFSTNGCACAAKMCGCCEHMSIPKISLNDTGCLNISYLPKEKGFDVKFTLNGRVMFEREVSLSNPPPICVHVPYLKEYAELCIRFHNITETHQEVRACVALEAELLHAKIYEHEFGCFNIPLLTYSDPEQSATQNSQRHISSSTKRSQKRPRELV